MVKPLDEVLADAEKIRGELVELRSQLAAEREALRVATAEAHEATRDLRMAVKEAKEEMRQAAKAEARKHLAKQMRAAADILAREQ